MNCRKNETNFHTNKFDTESVFESSWYDETTPIWIVIWIFFIEYFLLRIQRKNLPCPRENLLSICHGIFYYLIRIWIISTEYFAYIWLWENYSLFQTSFSNSWLSYVAAIIFVDFCYYWFHRFSHEIMIFWAIHQVHHSSLDMAVPVGIRHSPIQSLFSWIFYLPLAIIGLPVSHLMTHLHLNYMYQNLIHTETVDKLGPLEVIFNTPSHHRLHHGITKRAIDKNYGGILIIWDRFFGTFAAEERREDNIYGILYQPKELNIFSHQVFYILLAIEKAKGMSNRREFFSSFFKGPSWQPGYSRLGREIEITYDYNLNRRRKEISAPSKKDFYVFLHILGLLFLLKILTARNTEPDLTSFTAYSIFIIIGLANVGFIYENKPIYRTIELIRCFVALGLFLMFPQGRDEVFIFTLSIYCTSGIFWVLFHFLI